MVLSNFEKRKEKDMKNKTFIPLIIAISMVVTTFSPNIAYAKTSSEIQKSELKEAYERIMLYSEDNNIDLGMTFEDFLENYNGQPLEEYEQSYYKFLLPKTTIKKSSSSGGGSTYYYNTGFSCPSQATYSKYNLVDVVKKGDIIYEANGGFGITGHIAIVDGIYTRSNGSKYIRLIEAISNDYGGVTPHDILNSSKTYSVKYSRK